MNLLCSINKSKKKVTMNEVQEVNEVENASQEKNKQEQRLIMMLNYTSLMIGI